jgi:twitching motility protein PilT
MLDKINRERRGHIVTVEDPIEFVHRHQGCIVNQREVGADTKSFSSALKYALRQDPDVLLVGEMRDLETIQAALTIAETGHLAFATLHTNSAAEAITRIVDVFPATQQAQVRAQLAFVLEGIVTQTLVPRQAGRGRALAAEVLVVTPAIRALVREDKVHQIYSLMQGGKKYGMQTMNDALYQLYVSRQAALDECLRVSNDPNELLRMTGQQPENDPTAPRGPAAAQRSRPGATRRRPQDRPQEPRRCRCSPTPPARRAATCAPPRSRRPRATRRWRCCAACAWPWSRSTRPRASRSRRARCRRATS